MERFQSLGVFKYSILCYNEKKESVRRGEAFL